jgi:hypoxanthine phosphoribosyltransferase
MESGIQEILLTEEQIQQKVKELGQQLSKDYEGRNPLIICVLKGSFVFTGDLIKRMNIPIEIDFIALSSYGEGTQSSGKVRVMKDLDVSVEGRDVLVVEDIIDSGLTMSYFTDVLKRRDASTVKVVTLLDKPERRKVDMKADYSGFTIPDAFVVGYGLDYAEKFRNLPYIGILKPEVYS